MEAQRTTAALLAQAPDDPKRIFAHAQSQYYVGFINWRDGAAEQARAGFEAYARSAQRLHQMDPNNLAWQHEVAYAEDNLGIVAMRHDGDAAAAEPHLQAALQKRLAILVHTPNDADLQSEIDDAYAWVADSQRMQGDYASALANRMKEHGIIQALIGKDPRNVELRSDLLGNALGLARIEADQGQFTDALSRLEQAHSDAVALTVSDSDDAGLAKQVRILELFRVRTLLDMGGRRTPSPASLAQTLGTCAPKSAAEDDRELHDFCFALRARALAKAGDAKGAATARAQLQPRTDAYSRRWGLNFADEALPVRPHRESARG